MSVSEADIARALELFEGLGDVTYRKMFGGLGLYHEGKIFAVLMSSGDLRLKGQGEMINRFEALGMEQWTYQRPGQKASAMPYWALPEDMLDDPEAATGLAREALAFL